MQTRIVTDITTEPLDAEDLEQFIKFEDDEDENEAALIESMISACRAHFEKKTGLAFGEKTFATLFEYNDLPFILPVSPVISVDKVETVDYLGEKTELTLNEDYFKSGLTEVEIKPITLAKSDCLLVTYKAGYGETETEDLPSDLLMAMQMQIKQWYDNRDDFYELKILGSIQKILNLYRTKLI